MTHPWMSGIFRNIWGAQAGSALVSAFCRNELSAPVHADDFLRPRKSVVAECDNQHAKGVRSPDAIALAT